MPLPLAQLIQALLVDASASWIRMLIALLVSFVLSIIVGIYAARSRSAEKIILPIVDILQTLPILAFFPFVVFVIVAYLPPMMGINAAVVFLIITSMLWNMIFAVYESIKTLPGEFIDVARLYKMGLFRKLRTIYLPAVMPRLVEQSALSWSIGLFYLVTSEIFSTGSAIYRVQHGIGSELATLAVSGDTTAYAIGFAVFIIFVVATRYLLFAPLERRYTRPEKAIPTKERRLRGGAMHRLRLYKDLRMLYRVAVPVKRERATAAAKTAARKMSEQPQAAERTRLRTMYIVTTITVALLIIIFFATNATAASYEGQALVSLVETFSRVWVAFAIVLAISVPLCVYIIFISKRLKQYLTLFQILAAIPATLVLPVIAYMYSGSPYQGELVAVTIFVLSGIWYVIFSMLAEARSMPQELDEVKRLFHIKGASAWRNIYLKALAPGLLTGAVTGIAAEWNASIVAEYFTNAGVSGNMVVSSVSTGIGKLLDTSLGGSNLTLMVVALINLTVMIILINTFVWKRYYRRLENVYR